MDRIKSNTGRNVANGIQYVHVSTPQDYRCQKHRMKTKTTKYDIAEHLRTAEDMAAYLDASIEESNGDAAFIAKASLIELRVDYGDYLRTRDLPTWDKESTEAKYIREKSRDTSVTSTWYLEVAKSRPAEVIANICLCLLHQADFLLHRQLEALEAKFLSEGGIREKMYKARTQYRDRSDRAPS